MIKDNLKALLLSIIFVLLLLSVCAGVDYADEAITADVEQMNTSNCTLIDGVHYDNKIINNTTVGVAKLHKVVTEKPKLPLITIISKPSCGCRNGYYWHKRTFVNYCPYCHRYGVLTNLHKWPARHEQEISCSRCRSDWCGVCGKEKYSWSHYYLRRA